MKKKELFIICAIALFLSLAFSIVCFSKLKSQEKNLLLLETELIQCRDSLVIYVDKDYYFKFDELKAQAYLNEKVYRIGDTVKASIGILANQQEEYLYSEGKIRAFIGVKLDTINMHLYGDSTEIFQDGMNFKFEEVIDSNNLREGYISIPWKWGDSRIPFRLEYEVEK